eukprot:1386457-Pyramimonas_sp.AAC.1
MPIVACSSSAVHGIMSCLPHAPLSCKTLRRKQDNRQLPRGPPIASETTSLAMKSGTALLPGL